MHIVPIYLYSYHVEYTTDLGFPEEKTALSWSFRANLKQRSLLLRPGIDDGVPNSVPTHTVLRAHVVRSVCVSFAFALVGFADTIVFFVSTHPCTVFPFCAAYFHEWGSRLVVAHSGVESRGVVRHRATVFSGRRGTRHATMVLHAMPHQCPLHRGRVVERVGIFVGLLDLRLL